jgi:5-oxoprolinase (ATP-hydrolysing)
VANAPHLPVHLGAMQEAVRFQINHLKTTAAAAGGGGGWRRGDVLVTNHPQAGGSHLPDITVITPVFADEAGSSSAASAASAAANSAPVFFVANRGHHSDIGGISPGSMPPFSKLLRHEGAAIISFKLVQNGVFDEKGTITHQSYELYITFISLAFRFLFRYQRNPDRSA